MRPGIVHRIDRSTSGLVVVARNDLTHRHLMNQFAQRATRRRYLALVHGVPDPQQGTVRTTLARDRVDRTRMCVVPEEGTGRSALLGTRGKHAITHYRTLRHLAYVSVVEFHLETGRTHQVRVHASHLGHPLLGDETYGGAPLPRRGPQTPKRRERFSRLCANTLARGAALHAASLGFKHPITENEMDFHCRPHQDMLDAWYELAGVPEEGPDSGWLQHGIDSW